MKKRFFFSLLLLLAACPLIDAAETQQVERVVSLAPSITEILYAIGAGSKLIGRTSACDYPPDVLNVPIIGGFGKPSIEKIVSLHPDLVLIVDLEDKTLYDYMQKLGLHIAHIKCATLSDIPAAILQVGKLVGAEENAKRFTAKLSGDLEKIKNETRSMSNKPAVYVEIWNDPLTTAGKNSFVNELITDAGGINIADTIENDYFQVSPEWVVRKNPDVIICLYMSNKAGKELILERDKSWLSIKAVRDDKIFTDFDNSTILRPGPRVIEGILSLKSKIHPENSK
jgi:iron complex transport system substrate-binding protein